MSCRGSRGAAAPKMKKISEAEGSPEAVSSSLAELQARLLKLADGESPERAARLARLAADVRSGLYQVEARALASRLIDQAFDHDDV
mgnify:FL=1